MHPWRRGIMSAADRKNRSARKAYAERPEQQQARTRRYRGLPEPTRSAPLVCECCGLPPPDGTQMCLDHDHVTGAFRGWLCMKCNVALGLLGDTIEGLQRGICYLTRASVEYAS